MAPSRIEPVYSPVESINGTSTKKHNIYLLENFPPQAVRHCQSLFRTVLPDDPDIKNWQQNADAILVREKTISAEDIKGARKLRAIGKQGTGIDIIDQNACDKRGIPILNTPGVNAQSVAELVLSMTMAVARQLREISVKQAAGLEVRKEHCCGTTLVGKTIGIVGMGNIGTAVARMFRGAFGASVYACDPFATTDTWADIPHTRVETWEAMLPHIDVLTLHVPLNEKTRGMVDLARMKKMRPSAILINVARGGIVNEDDLVEALEQDILFGAGLDCHEAEPPTLGRYERLWATGKVISTPHIGATTAETQVLTATCAIDNVHKYLSVP
jgi:phosphoglycerate dehydrogenase-like enzyme